jgi:thiaminase
MPEGEEGAAEPHPAQTLAEVQAEFEADAPALSYAEQRLAELARLMTLGCRYEWMFWEMAWRQQRWPI